MILIGINHKNTPLNIREKFYFSSEEIADLQEKYFDFPFLILSTCNRTEVYFESTNVKAKDLKLEIDKVINSLISYKKLNKREIMRFFYIFFNGKAITHLFKVATSLNSMIVGENQILGQLKKAYAFSRTKKTTPYFNKVFQEAIAVGKKVRTNTSIGKGGVSLGSLTVDIVKTIFKSKKKLKLLVFGGGEIAEEVLKNLPKLEIEAIYLVTRSNQSKNSFAHQRKITLVDLEKKMEYVKKVDIIVTATSSKKYVISYQEYLRHLSHQFRLRLFVDLGVPRNIDPAISQMEDTLLYSLDDLKEGIHLNYSKRINEINQVKSIINEHIDNLEKWRIKKSFFEIYFSVERQIKNISDLEKKEKYLNKLHFFKKNLPENKTEFQKKINEMILFFVSQDIGLEINYQNAISME